ncbi:MAG TPA: AmmeMemoRadiSam system protein B, partial [Burkholderiaceae bacterium]|nr:AmmeMemoRadiSam system protein B [Burkholderiaceae bacterium]
MPALRLAVVDGLFYPAAPAALRAQVADYLAAAGVDDNDAARRPPKLLITPHAGYEYCGAVAASAYARLRGQRARSITRVVLLGPAHRVALDGL